MIKDRSSCNFFLERFLTAVILTYLIVISQQVLPKFKISFAPNQTYALFS